MNVDPNDEGPWLKAQAGEVVKMGRRFVHVWVSLRRREFMGRTVFLSTIAGFLFDPVSMQTAF